jgi:lysozyme family protein
MSDRFDKCLVVILREEGGYSNDPIDRGGATNYGIIQSEYDRWRTKQGLPTRSVHQIDGDEVREIYHDEYWAPEHCDDMPEPLDLVMFDGAVNHGDGQEIKFIQRAIGVEDDGVWGPHTAAALQDHINKEGAVELAKEVIEQRVNFYHRIVDHDPSQQRFLNGWLNRMAGLEKIIDGGNNGMA